uniref:Uncharacterized protein n=1 Tax=viral metagenome TaxID=1070528 RepID=A0A6C0AEA5_9ZZZZ
MNYKNIHSIHKFLFNFKDDKNFVIEFLKNFFEFYGDKLNLPYSNQEEKEIIVCKILNKKTIKNYPEYNKFRSGQKFNLNDIGPKKRKVLYFMSLLYGYIWYTEISSTFEKLGYEYNNFFDDDENRNKFFSYKFLKSKRLDNLDYYDLIENNDNILETKYRLKNECKFYKSGVTSPSQIKKNNFF